MFQAMFSRYILSLLNNSKFEYDFFRHKEPDVILTDNIGMALALGYDSKTMSAPTIILKGKNVYAKNLLETAKTKNIPVVENKLLTANLFYNAKKGQQIPNSYLQEIAVIFAKVYADKDLKLEDEKKDNQFDSFVTVQRKSMYETFSIQSIEKIRVDLSRNIFPFFKYADFVITVLGIKISKISMTENIALPQNEFSVIVNETIVNKGLIKYTNTDPSEQLKLHLTHTLTNYVAEIIGRDDVLHFINQLKDEYPVVVQEVIKYYSIGEIRKVLCGLLSEKISVQNIVTVLEIIADFGEGEHKIDVIIAAVRKALGRNICSPYLNNNTIKVIGIDYQFEKQIINHTTENKIIDQTFCRKLLLTINDAIEKTKNATPILVCSPINREIIQSITKDVFQNLIVLSISEIPNDVKIEYLIELKTPNDA